MSAAARRFSAFVGLFIERELSKYMLSVQSPAQTIGANARTERAFFNFGAKCADQEVCRGDKREQRHKRGKHVRFCKQIREAGAVGDQRFRSVGGKRCRTKNIREQGKHRGITKLDAARHREDRKRGADCKQTDIPSMMYDAATIGVRLKCSTVMSKLVLNETQKRTPEIAAIMIETADIAVDVSDFFISV